MNGKKKLREHADHPDHQKNIKDRLVNETLDYMVTDASGKEVRKPSLGNPSTASRIATQKAMLLAFVAEHTLPFSIVPSLLDLCKGMAEDKRALSKTTMSRTAATYTLTHGLASAFKNDLRETLQKSFFSLNVDEATNNGMDKILNILVRYFDDTDGEVKTEHLASCVVNQATALNLHQAIVDSLKDQNPEVEGKPLDIPVSNMVSCLMDNCATMRGTKAGVEALLRKDNPHLLDIAGDTIHTVANAAKVLFKPFDGYIENISNDIYYDLEKSPKAKDLFGELQILLHINHSSKNASGTLHILRHCPSRFLQMLTVSQRLAALLDVCRLYYFSFLTSEEQNQYRGVVNEIQQRHGVSEEAAARIKVIQLGQAKQAKSSANEFRKDRLLTALFKDFNKFQCVVELYKGLLEKFEDYTKLYQSEKPLLHTQHEQMFSLVRKLLVLFMKRQHVPDVSVKEMKLLENKVRDKEMQVSNRDLCVGEYCYPLYHRAMKDPKCKHWVTDLASKLRTGYGNMAAMLIQKLPLDNVVIKRLSCLHPNAFADESTHAVFRKLASSLPNVISVNELGALDNETRLYTVDRDVERLASNYNDETCRLDKDFWSHVLHLRKGNLDELRYPLLARLVMALISIFSGPLVEASFNIMDDCVRSDRTKVCVENYESVAVIRSALKARKLTPRSLPMTPKMTHYIKTSKARYVKHLNAKKMKQRNIQKLKLSAAVDNFKSKHGRKVVSKEKTSTKVKPSATIQSKENEDLLSAVYLSTSTSSSSTLQQLPSAPETIIPSASGPTCFSAADSSVTLHTASSESSSTTKISSTRKRKNAAPCDIRTFFKTPNLL